MKPNWMPLEQDDPEMFVFIAERPDGKMILMRTSMFFAGKWTVNMDLEEDHRNLTLGEALTLGEELFNKSA